MATLTIPDETLARLQAAAAAQDVSIEQYLDVLSSKGAVGAPSLTSTTEHFRKSSLPERIAAADSIRRLASETVSKSSIDELISDKHSGHRY